MSHSEVNCRNCLLFNFLVNAIYTCYSRYQTFKLYHILEEVMVPFVVSKFALLFGEKKFL